jgi:hypothetical protein
VIRTLRALAMSSALTVGLMFGPTAVSEAASTHTFAVDRATCAMFMQARGIAHGDTGSCRAVVTLRPAGVVPSALASTSCRGYWEDFSLYNYFYKTWTEHVNQGFCYNGSNVWWYWGTDCYGEGSLLFTSSHPWCGVSWGGSSATAGSNFTIMTFSNSVYRRYGYFRYTVNRFGQITAIWGSCCTG